MTRIIDLGNGYGRVERYYSKYASLTFPLKRYNILWLHAMEVIDDDEARAVLFGMGYDLPEIKWSLAVARVSVEQWREAIHGLGVI